MKVTAHDVAEARAAILKWLRATRAKRQLSKNDTIALFLKAWSGGHLDDDMQANARLANAKRDGTISRRSLHRWWAAADSKKTLLPQMAAETPEERRTSRNQRDAFFCYAKLWQLCRRDHNASVDWLIRQRLETLEELDLPDREKQFFCRVLAGEVIREFAMRKGIKIADAVRMAVGELIKSGSAFPAKDVHEIDENGRDWRRAQYDHYVANALRSLPDGVNDEARKQIKAKMERVAASVFLGDIDFIADRNAYGLFDSTGFDFVGRGEANSVKALLDWVDEANVPDLNDLSSGDLEYDISTVAAVARLYPDLELPLSKKNLRKKVLDGFCIRDFLTGLDEFPTLMTKPNVKPLKS